MQNEHSYTITGTHAARLASRDGLTLIDGTVTVRQVGWTGDATGANIGDYFRGGEYLGPDADGLEPVWADAMRAEWIDGRYVCGALESTSGDEWVVSATGKPAVGSHFDRSSILLVGGPRDGVLVG